MLIIVRKIRDTKGKIRRLDKESTKYRGRVIVNS